MASARWKDTRAAPVAPAKPKEKKMRSLHDISSACHRVIAEFEGSALFFPLPRDATFEDLADRLAAFSESHGGAPLRVEVTVSA
jgi:hypothetical protein